MHYKLLASQALNLKQRQRFVTTVSATTSTIIIADRTISTLPIDCLLLLFVIFFLLCIHLTPSSPPAPEISYFILIMYEIRWKMWIKRADQKFNVNVKLRIRYCRVASPRYYYIYYENTDNQYGRKVRERVGSESILHTTQTDLLAHDRKISYETKNFQVIWIWCASDFSSRAQDINFDVFQHLVSAKTLIQIVLKISRIAVMNCKCLDDLRYAHTTHPTLARE